MSVEGQKKLIKKLTFFFFNDLLSQQCRMISTNELHSQRAHEKLCILQLF